MVAQPSDPELHAALEARDMLAMVLAFARLDDANQDELRRQAATILDDLDRAGYLIIPSSLLDDA